MSSIPSSRIFVGAYATADQSGIFSFELDGESGALHPLGAHAGVINPSFILPHPNGRWLYAVSETSQVVDDIPGEVCAFALGNAPFALRPLNTRESGGDWPCHLALDASGRWLFTANYGSGSAAVFPLREDGSLGEMSSQVQHTGSGAHEKRQAGPHAHSVTLSPDNRFALVADLGIDQVVIYGFDAATGKLSPHAETHTPPGAGPRHLAFHPNGRWLYLANELNNTVVAYDYDASNAAMTEKQTLPALPPGAPENLLADIHVSADGTRLYASNRGHNSIAVYDIDSSGGLSLVAIPPCGGNWPRNFLLAPGGKFMLVANQNTGDVSVLPLQAGAPGLGKALGHAAVRGAACIQAI